MELWKWKQRPVSLYKPFIIAVALGQMEKTQNQGWQCSPRAASILVSLSAPKTPLQVVKELRIRRFKLKPFLEKGLVVCLNPRAKKGRLYITTRTAKAHSGPDVLRLVRTRDWDLIGWILASPNQRLPVLSAMDGMKRVSENIRQRASRWNNRLSRTSTKGILKELLSKNLVESQLIGKKRYYWKSDEGKLLDSSLQELNPIQLA